MAHWRIRRRLRLSPPSKTPDAERQLRDSRPALNHVIVGAMSATWSNFLTFVRAEMVVTPPGRRRLWRFACFTGSALSMKRECLAYTHVMWSMFAGLVYMMSQAERAGWLVIPTFALFVSLTLIILFDARYFLIPNRLIVLLSVIGLSTILGYEAPPMPSRLIAAASGFAVLRVTAWVYRRFRGEAGLGEGDGKLFSVAGLWLGFDGLPTCLVVAVFSALVSTAILFRHGALHSSREPIPFGPHLALGFWLVWTVGPLQGN